MDPPRRPSAVSVGPRSPEHATMRRGAVIPRLAAVAAAVAVVATASLAPPPAARAQTLDDLDDAEEVVDDLGDRLDAATDAYESTWAAIEAAQVELDALIDRAEDLAAEVDRAYGMVEARARSAFMRGTSETFELVLGAESSTDAVERAALLELLQRRDLIRVDDALALQVSLDQVEAEVADRQADLEAQRDQLRADAQLLQERLEEAEAEASTIRTLVARQRRVDRGAQQGIYACIFDPGRYRFRDTWGAPRSGGRSHKGTDIFAVHGEPTYAITSGVIQRHSNGGLGGIGLYLRGDDGNVYYYAHLESIDPSATVGTRVVAGDLIARNGSTGNADSWAPHVHFELRPGGGTQINPYPWLAAACF